MAGRSDSPALKINVQGEDATGMQYDLYQGADPQSTSNLMSTLGRVTVDVAGQHATGMKFNVGLQQPANNQPGAQSQRTQDSAMVLEGASSHDSRNEQNVNVLSGRKEETRNSSPNVATGNTDRMASQRNINDRGSYSNNVTVPLKAFFQENATTPQSTEEGQNGVEDAEIRRMSSEFENSNLHG